MGEAEKAENEWEKPKMRGKDRKCVGETENEWKRPKMCGNGEIFEGHFVALSLKNIYC